MQLPTQSFRSNLKLLNYILDAQYYRIKITTIPKIIKMAQDTKNESFLSHLIYLKKRNDFIYNIEDHVALVMPFLKKKRNDKQIIFINKLIKLIIKNNCQLTISKDNLLDKDSFYKIFPKVKKFKTLKKKLDKNCFFSSSYYERIL